ncbi:MAG: MFS transporter [Candidatus Nitrospinota bacterium M3_3B_026]
MTEQTGFMSGERRAIAGLSAVIGLRMLGLSLLIPVFSVYAIGLPGSSSILAGLAFGIYGLTQALLQIPFGYLSDKFGRKPVVASGLFVFGVGSVIAALTSNIYVLIAARFLQGAGAIASACFAWIADLTEESRRNRAMAFMGISIGGGVVLGMILGPVAGGVMGVPFLFWVAAALSAVAIYITVAVLGEPPPSGRHGPAGPGLNPAGIARAAFTPDLLRLDAAGFLVNFCMIGAFFTVPIRLSEYFGMGELWKVYIPLSVMGAAAMGVSSARADRGSARGVMTAAFMALALAFLILSAAATLWVLLAGFAVFFAGFSVLEATLPAAVSKLADPAGKGAVIGVFNLCQFSGTFAGGLAAGWLNGGRGVFPALLAASVAAVFLVGGVRGEEAGGKR